MNRVVQNLKDTFNGARIRDVVFTTAGVMFAPAFRGGWERAELPYGMVAGLATGVLLPGHNRARAFGTGMAVAGLLHMLGVVAHANRETSRGVWSLERFAANAALANQEDWSGETLRQIYLRSNHVYNGRER